MAELGRVLGFFFSPDQQIALAVNLGILAIGLVALSLLAAEGFWRLRRDEAALRELDADTVGARSSEEIVSAAEALPPDTAASQRVRDLVVCQNLINAGC